MRYDLIVQLGRDSTEEWHCGKCDLRPRLRPPPRLLLRWDVARRDNPLQRVDKEEAENLAVSRLRAIGELERLDAVLVDVRERDALPLLYNNMSELLVDGSVFPESLRGEASIIV